MLFEPFTVCMIQPVAVNCILQLWLIHFWKKKVCNRCCVTCLSVFSLFSVVQFAFQFQSIHGNSTITTTAVVGIYYFRLNSMVQWIVFWSRFSFGTFNRILFASSHIQTWNDNENGKKMFNTYGKKFLFFCF